MASFESPNKNGAKLKWFNRFFKGFNIWFFNFKILLNWNRSNELKKNVTLDENTE